MVFRILVGVLATLAAATSVTAQSIVGATNGPVAGSAGLTGASVTRDEHGRATVRAVRLTEPLRLDGRLDEEIYRTVPPIDGFLQQAAQAQDRPCKILCAPELKLEPTFTIEHLAQRPRLEVDGAVERVSRETTFELIFALDVPTAIPRIGLTLEAIVIPFGDTSVHPFTGAPASAAGRQSIRDNGIELESELNIELFDTDRTAGWVSSHFDIVDKFSPGETPRAGSVYTHKLNFEWDTAFHVFNRVPSAPWLRNVEVELSLDYLATGLPKAGDIVGDERFLDKASPWSLSFVFVFPLAPLNP